MKELSKTQIDRLGERLKKGGFDETDLQLLDEYRRSFTLAHEFVIKIIESQFALKVTGRPRKTTESIAQKLRRESIRLSQIQDIAGCRVQVTDLEEQNQIVEALQAAFEDTNIFDRRERPSNHYRAVHVVVRYQGRQVEIQVRTPLQQLWAELSEKCYDMIDPAIKYGGGDEKVLHLLRDFSQYVALHESTAYGVQRALKNKDQLTESMLDSVMKTRASKAAEKEMLASVLLEFINRIEGWRK